MTRKRKTSCLGKLTLVLLGIMGSFSQACYGASYATVYNVVDYGADPTGIHDSSSAITSAISAAGSAAEPGGTIYFPAGTFAITAAVAANMRQLNIVGSGVNATSISVSSTGSLTLSTGTVVGPYHFGAVKDFTLNCTPAKFAAGSIGVITQDVIGTKWSNIAIASCPTGIDMQDVATWTERNDFDDVTFFNCGTAVHFDRKSSDSNSSFGYNQFRIWVNTDSPGIVFLASGGATPYNSSYSVKGNLAWGSIIFDAHSDGYANSMYNNMYLVQVEDQPSGSGTSYLFDNHNVSGPNGEIQGVGHMVFGSHTQQFAPASVSIAVSDISRVPTDLGSMTTSAAASDVITNVFITPNSNCFVQPTNSTAASLTGVWISSISWTQAVLNHPTSHAGATFEVWCHP